jgi:hypothetical protein
MSQNLHRSTRNVTRRLTMKRVSLCAQQDSNLQPFDPKATDATGHARGSASVRDGEASTRDSGHTKVHTKNHPRIRPLWLDCPTPRGGA